MTITRTAWIDDDGSGTTGTVINNAEKQLLYDQIDGALGTSPVITNILPSFSANNGATWVVTNGQMCWAFNPALKLMYIAVQIISSTITGAPSNLNMTIPANRQCAAFCNGSSYFSHSAASYEPGIVLGNANSTLITLYRQGIGSFGAGAANGYFTIVIPVI